MCKHLLKIQRLILALLIFGGGIFYTSSATARVCFLPDSTDCGEGDVDVPEVQITCATYGGYETEAACLEARTNKTAQTCTLNSGCYYPKCAYDSERNCKNDNPDKNCLSQDVDGVKCWYSQPKTCSEQGYQKTPCSNNEDSGTVPNTLEASDGPCYKCTPKKECKYISNLYYGPNDTCPQYTDRKDAGVTGKDGVCSTCEPQACTTINTAYKSEAKKDTCGSNKEAKKVDGTDSAADGPCYTCVDKGDGSYDYIIYIVDTQSQENDKVTISRSVYSTDRNATFDAESAADVTEERCDWNCNCGEGGTSISLANGQTATYWNVNMEAGGGSSGECDYTRTYVSWNYTKVTVNGTTKEYKNTQCKDGTITDSKGTVYKIVCGIPTCSDIAGYQTTPCSAGYKQIDYIQLPHENCYKCEKVQTCSIISNGSWKGEKDKNTCPTGYKPEVVESTIGATVFSDGPCYSCEKIEDKTITIYLTNTETKDQSSSTLICNGKIERVNSTTKEYVEFSHDTNHTVKLRLNGPNKPCTELYADPIVLEEDNSYDLYAEFPSGNGSISGYYYDNVPTSFEVIVDGVVVASDEIRRGKIDNTNWTHLRVLSSLNGKVIQPSKSNPYTIKFVYENEKNNTCYKKSSEGEIENNSTIYYYPENEPYIQGECASEMTINVACNRVIPSYKPGGFPQSYRKLYINGKASMSPDGYSKPDKYESVEAHWYGYGNWMECNGCATVTCKFKYGDKTTIIIRNVEGEEEREHY